MTQPKLVQLLNLVQLLSFSWIDYGYNSRDYSFRNIIVATPKL